MNAARARLAEARRAVALSMEARDRAEAAWTAVAEGLAVGVCAAGDLELTAAHLRTLRQRAEARALDLVKTEQEQSRLTQALLDATTEHKKLELWQKRLAEAEAEEDAHAERRFADEQTARVAGRHS